MTRWEEIGLERGRGRMEGLLLKKITERPRLTLWNNNKNNVTSFRAMVVQKFSPGAPSAPRPSAYRALAGFMLAPDRIVN